LDGRDRLSVATRLSFEKQRLCDTWRTSSGIVCCRAVPSPLPVAGQSFIRAETHWNDTGWQGMPEDFRRRSGVAFDMDKPFGAKFSLYFFHALEKLH
jgi:hypothetical protein